jgi:hypothetical protein
MLLLITNDMIILWKKKKSACEASMHVMYPPLSNARSSRGENAHMHTTYTLQMHVCHASMYIYVMVCVYACMYACMQGCQCMHGMHAVHGCMNVCVACMRVDGMYAMHACVWTVCMQCMQVCGRYVCDACMCVDGMYAMRMQACAWYVCCAWRNVCVRA